MLGNSWLFIFFILFITALIVKQPALMVITFLFFLTSGLTRIWSRYSLQRFEYKRELSAKRVFFGERITLNISLSNSKFLPLPLVQIEEKVPGEVTFLKGTITGGRRYDRPVLSAFFSLSWYSRLTRRYPVQCMKRGVFAFGPSRIISGDPFGFFRNTTMIDGFDHIIVYPPVIPIEALGIPSRHPFGDLRIKRHLFEDPVQVMTTRDYVSGDPMKRIHWKASARTQRLQSRVFEHTTTTDMALFLNTRIFPDGNIWYFVEEIFETAIIAAAAIASHSLNSGYKVGLFVNELDENTILPRIPPSENPDQLKRILETLAYIRGNPFITVGIEKIISEEARRLSWVSTIVLVTAVISNEIISVLRQLRTAGRSVSIVLIGKHDQLIQIDGVTVYNIPEEVYRNHAESLRMEPVV